MVRYFRRPKCHRLVLLISLLSFHLSKSFLLDYRYVPSTTSTSASTRYNREQTSTCISLVASQSDNDNRQPARHPKIPQIRQKPRHRRPHNYWIEISNVRAELVELWNGVNVTIPSTSPPPIPSESLLNYWKRHDLRAAIATHGGREFLAEALEGALIIPGKWKLAVQTPIVQALLVEDSNLSVDNPPLSPQQLVRQVETATKNHTNNETSYRLRRWYHSSSRKPPGYWSSQTKVIEEL